MRAGEEVDGPAHAFGKLLELPDGIVEVNKLSAGQGALGDGPKEAAAVAKVIASMSDIKEPGKG